MIDTVAMPFYLLLIAIITLWGILGAKGNWKLKLFVMSTVSFLSVFLWLSLSSILGWPKEEIPVGSYDIVWAQVTEPNEHKKIKGGIFLWIANMKEAQQYDIFQEAKLNLEQRKPRAYELPYSREMHKQINMMKKILKEGGRVRTTIKKKAELGKKDGKHAVEQIPDLKFYVLPPPKAPKGPVQKAEPTLEDMLKQELKPRDNSRF